MEKFICFIAGMISGVWLIFCIVENASTIDMNRALSCMADGNSIAECQTILGINK